MWYNKGVVEARGRYHHTNPKRQREYNMTKLINVKRATVGQLVKADVSGFGEWLVGTIVSWTKTSVTFAPADGTEEVTVARTECYKATQAEFDAQAPATPAEPAKKVKPATQEQLADLFGEDEEFEDTDDTKFTKKPTGKVYRSVTGVLWTHEDGVVGHDTDEEEEHPLKKIREYAKHYETCLAASGKKSKDNGDQVAHMLRGKTLEEVYTIASDMMDVEFEDLVARYAHLNDGQQRMCVGNRLRGYIRKLEAEEGDSEE